MPAKKKVAKRKQARKVAKKAVKKTVKKAEVFISRVKDVLS